MESLALDSDLACDQGAHAHGGPDAEAVAALKAIVKQLSSRIEALQHEAQLGRAALSEEAFNQVWCAQV